MPNPPPPSWFDAALAAEVETGAVPVAGCEIAFRRWGDPSKPALLLVHGGGANSRWWDHVAPLLAKECCVTAIDMSGHGDSGRRPVYTFDCWAEEIAVMAGQGLSGQPPVILAHSLGGLASFRSAARYGEQFEGIIVIDSPVYEQAPEQIAQRRKEAFGPLRRYPSREDAVAHFRTVPEQPELLPYVVEHIAVESVKRVEAAGGLEAGWTWKFDPTFFDHLGEVGGETLGAISCRVAVLRAEFGLVTSDIGQHMYELLGRTAPVIELPLAHHHVMLDQPLSLVTAVRSLLADWRHSYAMQVP